MKDGGRKRIDLVDDRKESQDKLAHLRKKIKEQFPEALFASDQDYREYDLAIDICEDVPRWSSDRIDDLVQFCRSNGAQAKLSSIHVNTWFGDYDKVSGVRRLAKSGIIPESDLSSWCFIGDSPNDEPLFQAFQLSIGVANIREYLDKLTWHPSFITNEKSGAGFCEVARTLCKEF